MVKKKSCNTCILALYLYISTVIGHTNFTFGNRLPKVEPCRPKHIAEVSYHVYL